MKNAKYGVRAAVGRAPWSLPVLALAPAFRRRLVAPTSDLCIEGFPRSANTFMLHAIQIWNPGAHVAHHLHVPGHVVRASRLNVPVLLLVRAPIDALTSVLVVDPALRADLAVASYVDFLRRAWPVRDDVVVVGFDTATRRPDIAVEKLNARFGTSFVSGRVDDMFVTRVMAHVETANQGQPETLLAVPSSMKDARKRDARRRLERVSAMRQAQAWYERFRELEHR